MKEFIKGSLSFVLFFILFSVIINATFLGIIALTDWDFVKRIKSLRFDCPDYELLVLGTSLAEYGIDSELLSEKGIKSYNLAMVGSSNKTNYVQLEEYLGMYPKKPGYVFLALNSFLESFNQEGIQPVVEFTMKGHKYGLKDIPISKFNWAGMELLKKIIRKQYRETYVSSGQKKCIYFEPDKTTYQNISLNLEKYETATWIGEIAKLCRENGINLIVIDMPGIKETQNESEVGPYEITFKNGCNATFFNFNNQAFCKFIDYEHDWAGMSHFNKYGAEKFTNAIFDIIFKN